MTEVTFVIYGVCLFFSLIFLLITIWRISALLKRYQDIKLNESHIGIHALLLVFNVLLSFIMFTSQINQDGFDETYQLYISLFYFALQPPSLVLMLHVITRMSAQSDEENLVHLFVDDLGNYRFIHHATVSGSLPANNY